MEGMDKRMKMKEKCVGCGGKLWFIERDDVQIPFHIYKIIWCDRCKKGMIESWPIAWEKDWLDIGGKKHLADRYNFNVLYKGCLWEGD